MSGHHCQPLRGGEPAVPGHAVPRAARPQLRVIGGGLDDTVVRRKRFEVAHPEIVITPPGTQASMWTALSTRWQDPRQRISSRCSPGHARPAAREAAIRRPPSPQEPWPARHSPSSALSSGSGTAADSSDHTS